MTAPATVEEYLFPLSFAQSRLWFLAQLEPDDPSWSVPLVLRLRGPLDAARLDRAVQRVVDRQEILRTRYDRTSPVQIVAAEWTVATVLVDLTGCPEAAVRVAREIVGRPFALWDAPPLRVTLLRLHADEHWLVVALHHIACDGRSVRLLAEELSDAYAGRSDRSELDVQYGDYALWQRDRMSGDRLAAALDHWTAALSGAPAAIDLPTDRPRPPVPTHRGGRVTATLDAGLTVAVDRAARAAGASPFMLLLAAFALVLARVSGQDDVVVGAPSAGRDRPETEPLVGCFLDVLPLRIALSGATTAGDLLARVRDAARAAYAYADVPFERIVAHLAPERDLARPPIFQTMLSLHESPPAAPDFAGLTATPVDLGPDGPARYDLTVDALVRDGRLTLALEYNADVFTAATAERTLARIDRAVRFLASARPDTRLDRADLLVEGEAGWLAAAGTGPAPTAGTGSAADLVPADRDDIAVTDGGGAAASYRDLADAARRTAAGLVAAGVGRGDTVGIVLGRGVDLVPAVLGTWLAGAAYVPLDPTWPAARRDWMAADAGVRFTIGVDPLPPAVPFVRPTVTGDDAAYLMYTSGSTGTPKGVVVPHSAVRNLLVAAVDGLGLTRDDRLVAVTTLAFDISVLELFAPLVAGGRVVVATDEQATDPDALAGLIDATGATVVQATPSTWRMLRDAGWTPPAGLRVLSGGEALPAPLAASLARAGADVWNLYGPTETTVWSTWGRVDDPADPGIGRPVAGTDVHVLGPDGRAVPPGTVGELYIGGAGLARGYHRRAGLTADRFRPADGGRRRYRTGDRAAFAPDGTLRHHGRVDRQLKVRGHRLEPGEVEARLVEHPGVAEAVVTVEAGALVAHLVAAGTPPADAELRAHLRRALPPAAVPARYGWLDRLPRTANGKVDVAALPAAGRHRPEPAAPAPRTATEAAVLDCFRRVLDDPEVDLHADFFDAGGSSLTVVALVAAIADATGVRLGVGDLFVASTPADIAALLATNPPTDRQGAS